MLVYVIRHTESLSNTREADGLNAGLSDLGRRQSAAVAKRFESIDIQAVYCSPFLRCLETAKPIAAVRGLPIRIRPDLSEHHHLPAGTEADDGLDSIEVLARENEGVLPCPDYSERFEWVPVDEPFADLLARMRSFSSYLKNRWTGDSDAVVVVSHGSPIARLIEAWLTGAQGPSFRFIIDNGAVSALRHHQEISSLICLNEISHLHGLPAPASANYRNDGSIRTTPQTAYW